MTRYSIPWEFTHYCLDKLQQHGSIRVPLPVDIMQCLSSSHALSVHYQIKSFEIELTHVKCHRFWRMQHEDYIWTSVIYYYFYLYIFYALFLFFKGWFRLILFRIPILWDTHVSSDFTILFIFFSACFKYSESPEIFAVFLPLILQKKQSGDVLSPNNIFLMALRPGNTRRTTSVF